MKRTPLLVLAIGLMVILPRISHAQISNSDHDFSGKNWNNTGEVCAVCHAPHAANTDVEFLWAHELTTAPFTEYSSTELDATVGQPAGASKLCLSCHDGTVAVDNFGGRTNGGEFLTGSENVGSDMMANHPVSFTYDAALASTDGELYDPTTTNTGLGGTIAQDMLNGAGQLECTSCHDPHEKGAGSFLIMSNAGSALCLTCHQK